MTECNCEFCIKCEHCGHKADEHIAGDGQCFKCKCPRFFNAIDEAWKKLPSPKSVSFEEFANNWSKQ